MHYFHPTSSLPILLLLLVAALLFHVWVVQEIFLGNYGRDEKIVHEQYKDRLTIQGKMDRFSYFLTKIQGRGADLPVFVPTHAPTSGEQKESDFDR